MALLALLCKIINQVNGQWKAFVDNVASD
jgi:hypothetical protein